MSPTIGDDNIDWDLAARNAAKDPDFTSTAQLDYFQDLIKPGMKMLDLGCCVGKWYPAFQKLGVEYEGLDFSPVAIQIAREKFPDIIFHRMKAQEIPFKNRYNLVFTHTMLQHTSLESKKQIIPRIRKALTKGGYLIIQEKSDVKTITTFTKEGWIQFITSFGFRFIRATEEGDPRNGYVFQKREMNIPMDVAAIILTKNEEPRIEACLKHIRPHVDYILVLDGESKDKTVKIAKEYADRVEVRPFSGSFAEEKNHARTLVPKDCGWILWCDADERFDDGFLRNIKGNLEGAEKNHQVCFRFPRINLPNGKDWPDYQVRLFKNSRDIEWRGKVHEVPYFKPEDIPLDQIDQDERERILGVSMVDRYPILHLPRRKEGEREWW